MRTQLAVSAGGVTLAERSPAAPVVLVSRYSPRGELQWTLPKGRQEAGETVEQTAVREVREETGLHVEVLAPLDTINYWFVWTPEQTRYHKFVHFFLMLATGGDLTDHDTEVEEARWFAPAKAVEMLSFPNERRLLALTENLLGDGGA